MVSDILNKHSLNINHLNDSIISNPTIINDLKTENNNYSGSTEIVGHTNVEKKTTEQKVVGNVPSYENKLYNNIQYFMLLNTICIVYRY